MGKRTAVTSMVTTALTLACIGLSLFNGTRAEAAPSSSPDIQLLDAGVQPQDQALVDRFWQRAMKEDYRSPAELKAQDQREMRKGFAYKKLMHGNPAIKALALTFDDGPHPQYTPRLLAILNKYHVKATFFVIGKMVEQYPDLVKLEDAQGNLVANHTYHHVNLKSIPIDRIAMEWNACNDAVEAVIGKRMRYCRPPGGDYDGDVIKAAMDADLTTALWTDDPGDYASPGDKVIDKRVLSRISNGGIILLHDGVQETIDVLPQIIETLQKRGFKFQTAEEMDSRLRSPQHSSGSNSVGQTAHP
jgi:peptidoglycan-N-acetylglucosamine deacetylase